MTKKIPLSTTREARSSLFPASNHFYGTGANAEATHAEALRPIKVTLEGGAYAIVSGRRVERHRRMLDHILDICPGVHAGGNEYLFFIDIKEAAKRVFGQRSLTTRAAECLVSMLDIRLDFYEADDIRRAGGLEPEDITPDRASGLATEFIRSFTPGEHRYIDHCVAHSKYDASDLKGRCVLRLSSVYMTRLASGLTLSYGPALEYIFQMGPVAAQLSRYALSHQFLSAASLEEVLDVLGAPTGGARGRAVSDLRTVEKVLLERVGIFIREFGPRGKLVVDYRAGATGRTLSITQRLNCGRPERS